MTVIEMPQRAETGICTRTFNGPSIRKPANAFNCPDCNNTGYIEKHYPDGQSYMQECKCRQFRKHLRMLDRSGLREMIKLYRLDKWQTLTDWQQTAKRLAMNYIAHPSGWFVAVGAKGSGKTHLCTAVASELLNKGNDTLYVLWRNFSPRAKAAINSLELYDGIVTPLKEVSVLYIDDLFKTGKGEQPTVADVNLVFEILNERYLDPTKLTIISTEFNFSELLDIDEAVGSRIYERSKGYRLDFTNKPNWRLRE